MKTAFILLSCLALSLNSCKTPGDYSQYVKPGSYLITKTILDKDSSAATKQNLIKLSDHIIVIADRLTGEMSQEEFLVMVAYFDKSKDWLVFANYLYDIYKSKLSEVQLGKVKATSEILHEIAVGIRDAVTVSGK